MKTADDKRRAPRARHDSVVEIFDATGSELIGTARLVDFSKSGLCIAGHLDIEKDSRVHARVRLLREGILDVVGKVVWIRQKPNNRQYGISVQSSQPIPH